MYLRLKELILSLDLIFTGKEFHNKIDDVKIVLPPSVFLLYLGHPKSAAALETKLAQLLLMIQLYVHQKEVVRESYIRYK